MTSLPANDAFALGLAHDDSNRRPQPRSRSLPRSQSPKIPFPPPKPASSHPSRVERGLSRRANKQANTPNLHSTGDHPNGDVHLSTNAGHSKLEGIEEKHEHSPRPATPPAKKQAIDLEIPRKVLHSSIGFLTVYLYQSGGSARPVIVVLATALATVIAPADAIRLRYPRFERLYERAVGFLMRESEKKSTNGVIWYIIGVLFVLVAFPLDIAVVSILILSWADTNASTFGRLWGRYTPALPKRLLGMPLAPRKSLAGFVASSVTGCLTAMIFWGYIAPLAKREDLSWTWGEGVRGPMKSIAGDAIHEVIKAGMNMIQLNPIHSGGWIGLGVIGMVAGIVSGVAEALDLGSLDDNLTLPIISGTCLWGFFKFFGYMSS